MGSNMSELPLGQKQSVHSRQRLYIAAIIGAVVAAGLTWGLGESLGNLFRPKEVDPLKEQADLTGFMKIILFNAAVFYGIQGALFGLMLGLVGRGLASASRFSPLAGLIGLGLGGILGAAGAFGFGTAFFAFATPISPELGASLLMHIGIAALIGVAAGLAFGIGTGRNVPRAVVGGLIGACIGAAIYEVLGAVLFPIDKTGDPVAASSTARLLWHALCNLSAAIGAVTVLTSAPKAFAPPSLDAVTS